jgi:hypothetical protein
VKWCVSFLTHPLIFIGQEELPRLLGHHQGTNEVVTCGAEEWGQVGESSMRRSCRLSGRYTGMHLASPLACHDKRTRGRAAQEASRWVRPNWGIGRPRGSSVRISFRLGDCQVVPKVGMGVFAVFLSCYLVVVGPWIRMLAPDWSRVCFFGLMRCHGHVGACVAARHHVAWCGSHRAHMMSNAYLSHTGSDVCK